MGQNPNTEHTPKKKRRRINKNHVKWGPKSEHMTWDSLTRSRAK